MSRAFDAASGVAGFSPRDGRASIESAWARLDTLGGTTWLNLKVGKFELDLPVSARRSPALSTGHAAYAALPQGSLLGQNPDAAFALGENQVGIEVDGHDDRSVTRWALSVTSAAGEVLSNNAWSTPFVHLHLQRAFEFVSPVLSSFRVGALGGVGWWPTRFEIDPATPVAFTLAYIRGQEAKGVAAAGTTDPYTGVDLSQVANSFQAGFVEVSWVPVYF